MTIDKALDFFSQHGTNVSLRQIQSDGYIPFRDKFQCLVDVLSRKLCRNALLDIDLPDVFNESFAKAFLYYLNSEQSSVALRKSKVIYLDMQYLSKTDITLDQSDFVKANIIILANTSNAFVDKQILPFLNNAKARFILLNNPELDKELLKSKFQFIDLQPITENDQLALLDIMRIELAQYHQTIIPNDATEIAFRLASRYISTQYTLEKSLLLLDSAAARSTPDSHMDIDLLKYVLTSWTQIPFSHIQTHSFNITDLAQSLRQHIFDQEIAITALKHGLQDTSAKLEKSSGPLCSFLFVGPKHSGKNTTVCALVKFLYNQPNVLHSSEYFTEHQTSLLDVKFSNPENRSSTLKEIIANKPYAVILINDIEMTNASVRESLNQLLTTGILTDSNNDQIDFQQSIIILTTTLGSDFLTSMSNSSHMAKEQPVDLMQIITKKQKQLGKTQEHRYSSQEIMNGLLPAINTFLPTAARSRVHIVPFFPLGNSAIEKIIHSRLEALDQHLTDLHGIELSYAEEIVSHLVHETNIEKTMHHLYMCLEHAIATQADNATQSRQLKLQLNETGQSLRCDWVDMTKQGVG